MFDTGSASTEVCNPAAKFQNPKINRHIPVAFVLQMVCDCILAFAFVSFRRLNSLVYAVFEYAFFVARDCQGCQ